MNRAHRRAVLVRCAVAVAVLAVVAGCTSSKEKSVGTPTSSVDTGPACGFVPAAAITDVVGTAQYTTTGSLTGSGLNRSAACSVIAPDNDAPAVQVLLGPGSTSLGGATAVSVRANAAEHAGDWFIYPTAQGVGWAHPQYEATVDGTKVTGALTYLVRGDAVVGVRLLRPRPGRDAVQDAVSLATAAADELGLTATPSK